MIKSKRPVAVLGQPKLRERVSAATTSFTLLLVLSGLIAQYQIETIKFFGHTPNRQPVHFAMSSAQETNPQQQLIKANTIFGFKLFSALIKQDRQENVFVSPTSISLALSILYNGAGDKTQEEIGKTLAYQGMSLDQINLANQRLQQSLETKDEKVELAIANSLWAREGVSFRHQFLKNNQEYYQTEITNLDFSSPESVRIINRWVGNKTRDKIDQIIEQINPEDVLFIINAIYFKGIWQTEFDKQQTSSESFYLANGKTKQHPFMSRQDNYRYYENGQFQAVSLPYGEGRLSMYLFLPREDIKLDSFFEQLTPENWSQWLSEFRLRDGALKMPRFKLEYGVTLNEVLQKLGMLRSFDPQNANFSQMTSTPVFVNEIKHKTFVEVNEEGTEAAAVTSIGIRATSANMDTEPFTMIVNRPFFCVIRDNQTEAILFMGAIFEPK